MLFEDMAVMKMADSMTINGRTANDVGEGHRGPVGMKKLASWGLLLLVALCALTGCERGKLLKVERIMEQDIDTADTLIYSMDEPFGKRNRALYALLKTQIDYKMYRDAVNDSTIRIATDFYGKRYKDYHAAMAWYSLGCVTAELGQDSTAADAYLTAIALFPDTMVRYYALAEQNLSQIYLDHNMNAESIQLIKACRSNATRLKDSTAIAFCDYNIANSLLYNNNYAEAKEMFLKLKDNEWMSPSTKNVSLLKLSIISLCEQNYQESIGYADSFIVKNNNSLSYGAVYSTKADALFKLSQNDSALYYYRLSLIDSDDPYTICDTYRCLAEIHSLIGNQDSAKYYTKMVGEWADSIVSISNSEIILRALLNNARHNLKPKSYRYIIFRTIFFTVLFIIVSCLLYLIYKNRKKSVSNEEGLKGQTINMETIVEPPTKDIQIEIVEGYNNEINTFKESEVFLTMISVTSRQKVFKGTEITNFQKVFRKEFLKLRAHLASSYNLNDDEIDFCIYSLLGFKQKDFCTLSFITHHRMIKYRIKEKIPTSLFEYIFKTELV